MDTLSVHGPSTHIRREPSLARRLLVLLAAVTLVAAACNTATSSQAPASQQPSQPSQPSAAPGTAAASVVPPSQQPTQPAASLETKRFRIVAQEPDYGLDPTKAASASSWRLIELLGDPLFDRDQDFLKIPWLAEKWETEENGKVWVFTLRPDLKFSDGSPLTAEDVKFTFDLYKTTDLWKSFMSTYESSEVVDPSTFRMTLTEPRMDFFEIPLSQSQYVILSKAAYATTNDASLDKTAATSGPYRIKEYVAKSHITFERNPFYWRLAVDGYPKFSEVRWDFVGDQAAQVAGVQAGSADFTSPVAAEAVDRLKADPNVTLYQAPSPGLIGFGYDKTKPPFSDKRVRQAIGLATDSEESVAVCWFGTGTPLYGGLFYPWQDFYDPARAVEPWKRPRADRLADAKKLLDEAGWVVGSDGIREAKGVDGVADGTKFSFVSNYPNNWTSAACQAQLYQKWLKDIEIDAQALLTDPANYGADLTAGKFASFHIGWFSYLSAREIFHNIFLSDSLGNDFTVREKSPELDAKILAAEQEADPAKQAQLYSDLEREAADLQLITFVNSQDVVAMTSSKVTGFYTRLDMSNRALIVSDIAN